MGGLRGTLLLPLGTEVTIWLKGPLPSLFWARTLNW